MGDILSKYTFDRNTVKRNAELSATAVRSAIESVAKQEPLDKAGSNIVGALTSYMGVFQRQGDELAITDIGQDFLVLYQQAPIDAWRWLLTRSLWLFVVPNGTRAGVNDVAKGSSPFNLFILVLKICLQLQARPESGRFLYYDEFCEIFSDDANWFLDDGALLSEIYKIRRKSWIKPEERPGLIDALEPRYDVPRDNLSTVFSKAFGQTGLFEFIKNKSDVPVGIAIAEQIDTVMQRRVRFVVDHPTAYRESEDWQDYLKKKPIDLPVVASLSVPPEAVLALESESPLKPDMVKRLTEDLSRGNLVYEESLIRRLFSSLLAKNFVILAGQSGSGKTRLALSLAKWFARLSDLPNVLRMIQGNTITAAGDTCEVTEVDDNAATVRLPPGRDIIVPLSSIEHWLSLASRENLQDDPGADSVGSRLYGNDAPDAKLLPQHLLGALTIAILKAWTVERFKGERGYRIIAVGADWTTGEPLLGYADTLDPTRYVRRGALDLILEAHLDPNSPYFLILDEMNLSHVERYFSVFLSAVESGGPVELHSAKNDLGMPIDIEKVPPATTIPSNLFVIGTINVDETTYTFSPKVLDRANVIEMRTTIDELGRFLADPKSVDLLAITGKGRQYAKSFCGAARSDIGLSAQTFSKLDLELRLLFEILQASNREFGLRSAREIVRFAGFFELLSVSDSSEAFSMAVDAQILQKILPRFNGSSEALSGALQALIIYCFEARDWDVLDGVVLRNRQAIIDNATTARTAIQFAPPSIDGVKPLYPMSFKKSVSLFLQLQDQGFVSFSEG